MNTDSIPARKPLRRHYEKMDIVFTIVQRGFGEQIVKIAEKSGSFMNLVYPGKGSATSGILQMLGLGPTEKDVVLSFIKSSESHNIISIISEQMDFAKPGTGISFSVPMQSIAGAKVLQYLATYSYEED